MITSKATEPTPVKQLTMPLRLAQQNMATTNTLAYFVTESVAKKKVLQHWHHQGSVI